MAKKKVTKEEIIREALTLFRDNGYHATSMSDIGEACGLLKGSIYHYFSGKEKLMIEVINYLHEYYRHNAFRHAYDENLKADEKLKMLVKFYEDLFFGQNGGCLMANIAMETANVVPVFNDEIAKFFQEWIDAMAHIYEETMTPEVANDLARETVAAVEGATMLMRVFNNRKYLRDALDNIKTKYELLNNQQPQPVKSR